MKCRNWKHGADDKQTSGKLRKDLLRVTSCGLLDASIAPAALVEERPASTWGLRNGSRSLDAVVSYCPKVGHYRSKSFLSNDEKSRLP